MGFGSMVLRISVPASEQDGKAEPSLLEQIVKRRPRTAGLQTRRSRSLFLASHSNLKELAGIPFVLLRDPLLHRLHAFEPAARIEIGTLLARMQFESALRTLPLDAHTLQHSPALRAAGHGTRSRQVDRLRTQGMVPTRRPTLAFRWRLPWRLPTRFSIVVLISRLTVFGQKNLPKRWPYCAPDRARWQVYESAQPSATDSHGSSRIPIQICHSEPIEESALAGSVDAADQHQIPPVSLRSRVGMTTF